MNIKPGIHIWYILPRTKRYFFLLLMFLCAVPRLSGQAVEIQVNNEPLNRVLMEMARDYGIQLSFDAKLLSSYTVTLNKSFANPEYAIAWLIRDYPLDYKKIGEVFTIYSPREKELAVNHRLWGKVVDSESGESLPYSHIVINESGVVTDFNGNFSFVSADSRFHVRASYLGYYIKDTTLSPGAAHTLHLTPSIIGLQEVVVEGSLVERSGQIGEEAGVAEPLALLRHPAGHLLLPGKVVLGLLVTGEIFLAPIRFVQEELGRIVLLLQNVEAHVARLLAGAQVILPRGFDELLL